MTIVFKQRKAHKAKEEAESTNQNSILTWLNYQPQTFAFRINTMGVPIIKNGVFKGFRPAPVKGVSDIICIHRGMGLCLEVKTLKGRLKKDQAWFLQQVEAAQGIGQVVRSLDDAISILDSISKGKI